MPKFYRYTDSPQAYNERNEAVSFDQYKVQGGTGDYSDIQTLNQPTPDLLKPTRYTAPAQNITPAPAPGQTPLPVPTAYNGNPILDKPTLGVVDENTIREETRKRMQAQIDAINAQYANMLSQERVQGEDRTGQTRAINARSGLMGSDFGAAHQEKTTQFNKQQEKFLMDEQNAKIQAVLANIEDRASAEIQMRKQEALGKYQMEMGEYEQAQEAARADLKILAESGVDLNSLNPAQKAALLKQSGYEGDMGELIYNAMKPKPKQIEYKYEKLHDGKGMFWGVDPQTGELKRLEIDIDLPPDWSMEVMPDGTIVSYNKNTNEAQILSGKGEFAKPEDPLEQAYKQAQIAKIQAEISKMENEGGGFLEDGTFVVNRQEAQKLNQNIAQSDSYKAVIKAQDAMRVVEAFEKAWNSNKQGTGWLAPGKDKVEPAYRTAVLTLKEFFNLGVLNGPDLSQIEGILKNPFSLSTNLRGKDSVTESIQNMKEMIKRQTEDRYQDIKGQYQNYSPEQLTNLKEANRIYNQLTGNQDILNEAQQFLGAPEGGSEGKDFFKVKGTQQKAEQMKPISNTPYLKTLGAITGIDGSKYWKWGLDVDLKKGDKVKSPVNGQIIAIKTSNQTGGFGNQIRIKSDDGKEIWLSHLDKLPNAKPGTRIKAGQVLALGGNSGNTYSPGGGDGSHLDITMPKPGGGYYTAREVKAYLDNKFV